MGQQHLVKWIWLWYCSPVQFLWVQNMLQPVTKFLLIIYWCHLLILCWIHIQSNHFNLLWNLQDLFYFCRVFCKSHVVHPSRAMMTLTNTYKLEDWVRWVLRWLIRPILALKDWLHVEQTREESIKPDVDELAALDLRSSRFSQKS